MIDEDRKISIAFDINGTLTQERIRQLFWALDRSKCQVIAWSTLGKEYCRRFCKDYDLKPDEILNKQERFVDIAVDDFPESISEAGVVLGC